MIKVMGMVKFILEANRQGHLFITLPGKRLGVNSYQVHNDYAAVSVEHIQLRIADVVSQLDNA